MNETNSPANANAGKRRSYLGGTDMAAILGRSQWKTPLDVWMIKTGRTVVPQNEAMGWGLLLEPVILQEYARRTGQVVTPGGWKKHASLDFIGGSADAFARPATYAQAEEAPVATLANPEGLRLLEVKTAGWSSRRNWDRGIPFDYQCQAQLYMHLHGLELATFVVLFGGNQLETFDLEADPILQHAMLTAAQKFWTEHVVADIPPHPADGDWKELAGDSQEKAREAASDAIEALTDLLAVRETIRAAEDREELIVQWLQEYVPEGSLTVAGKPVASWQTKTRKATVLEAKTWRQFNIKPSAMLRKILDNRGTEG